MGAAFQGTPQTGVTALPFFKMSGSGNDFVFLDGRVAGKLREWPPERIAAICARGTGIGADGLVILEPDSSKTSSDRVRFNYFNADGCRSDMCGNGSLCATRLSARLGLAPAMGMTLMTDVGDFATRCIPGPGERAQIDLNTVSAPTQPPLELAPGETVALQYLVGVPHVVLLVNDVDADSANPSTRGRTIRSDPAVGKTGANVNFVSKTPKGLWRFRTYERGVETETLACGTGAVAVAAALRFVGGSSAGPVSLLTSSGRVLEVDGTTGPSGGLEKPTLTGEGRLVYSGELFDSA